ncbi:transcriptional regulator [Rhodococcus sp. 06-621-2]|nr:TenA family protein [Rhodococcus sp. 06-621-2]OZC57517.1 transcriptional regulator [Rhodococcus sp. 06-621-2]
MSRSVDLVDRQRDNLAQSRCVEFIVRSIDGSLSDVGFRKYLVIEEAFVLTAVQILGLVVSESESLDDAFDHVVSLSNLVGEQRRYFADLRSEFPYDGDVGALVMRSSALTTYALGLAREHGRTAALVGMFAAETLYLSWCREAMAVDVTREPALAHWIAMHTEPAFVGQVEALAVEVDAIPENITDDTLDTWFSGMLSAEDSFHQAAGG